MVTKNFIIKFNLLSSITAIIAFSLFICLLTFPEIIFLLFAIEGNEAAYFISRRAAMLFLGFAIISYLIRNETHSNLRQITILGFATSMLSLALIGSYELFRGFAGVGILLAIITELLLAISYFLIWHNHRKPEV